MINRKQLRGSALAGLLIKEPEASATTCSSFSQVVMQRTLAPRDLGTAREQVPSFMRSEEAWLETP